MKFLISFRRFGLACLLLLITSIAPTLNGVFAQKSDLISTTDGYEVIGEVKGLERGLLKVSVDGINGSIQFKWEHVRRLTCAQYLDIEDRFGNLYFGLVSDSGQDGLMRVVTLIDTVDLAIRDVVYMEPIKDSFLKQLVGSASAGLSYTKSTNLLQFNVGANVSYRALKSLYRFNLNSILTTSSDNPRSMNTDATLSYSYQLKNLWFVRADLGYSRNDELGIEARTNVAVGVGKGIFQTTRQDMSIASLISVNRERKSDGNSTTNPEIVLDFDYLIYKFDSPKIDIAIGVVNYLGLRDFGRYRFNTDVRISLEIIGDLYWDISQFYFRYDSSPSEVAESKSDFGVVTGLRYTF